MNYTRNELIQADATMNQMRNAIYHLARFMDKNGVSDKEERFRRMGTNIGRTFTNYWTPTDLITLSNLKDVISTIYQKILGSTALIEINEKDKMVSVKDYKCALCKYKYDDVNISGCEIIITMLSEIINLIGEKSKNPTAIFLKPLRVKESKAYGHGHCLLEFSYSLGGQ